MQDMGELFARIRKLSDKELYLAAVVVETELNIREAANLFAGLKKLMKEVDDGENNPHLVLVDSASGKMGGGQTP